MENLMEFLVKELLKNDRVRRFFTHFYLSEE